MRFIKQGHYTDPETRAYITWKKIIVYVNDILLHLILVFIYLLILFLSLFF